MNPGFIVMCRVSGGVTGTREAVLRANDLEIVFATRELAQAKATELNTKMNHMYAVAFFEYWVEARS